LTDFRKFLTAIYNNELRNKNLLKFSPHLNLLPHYLVKLEMLYNEVIFNSKLTQNVMSQY